MPSKEDVEEKLKDVVDPHTGMDVHSMGLISDLEVKDDSISLTFTPTSPFCPLGVQLAFMIKKAILGIEGVEEDKVDIVIKGHINEEDINKQLSNTGE